MAGKYNMFGWQMNLNTAVSNMETYEQFILKDIYVFTFEY